jgi:hypothetical protein
LICFGIIASFMATIARLFLGFLPTFSSKKVVQNKKRPIQRTGRGA